MALLDFFTNLEKNFKIVEKKLDNQIISNIIKNFKFLIKLVDISGKVIDPYLRSSLDFQYHYPFMLLSGYILFKINYKSNYNQKLNKLIKYWVMIPKNVRNTSLEFNNFALCFIYSLLTNFKNDNSFTEEIKPLIEKEIINMKHNNIETLLPKNNNFTALTALNLYLYGKLTNNELEVKKGISMMRTQIIQFQMNDGFFPDTNMGRNHHSIKNKGITHLTYHSKISMLVALLGIFLDDEEMINSAIKGFDNIEKISSLTGEEGFYGRSQNAIFGYACLFLGLNLIYKFIKKDIKYLLLCQKILDLSFKYQKKNGFFSLNLNNNLESRPGFDRYMFPVVYNAYANAFFLLGIVINPEILNLNDKKIKKDNQILYYNNSGFLKIKNNDIEFCLNTKGHINSIKHYMDSRVSPFSLLYLTYKSKDILPSIPIKYLMLSNQVRKPNKYEIIINQFQNLAYNVAIGGFQPIFKKASKLPILFFYLSVLLDINIIYLNQLILLDIFDKNIKFKYNLKKSNLVHPWFLFGKKLLNYIIFNKSTNLKANKKNANIELDWDDSNFKYTIHGPPGMFCYFPIRFFRDIKILKRNKRFLKLKTVGDTVINLKTNIDFKLFKAFKKFYAGKGNVIIYYLLFYQSNNLIIEIEMV